MIYLYSKFECFIIGKAETKILPNVFYEISNIKTEHYFVCSQSGDFFALNLCNLEQNKHNKDITIFTVEHNTFIMLWQKQNFNLECASLKLNNTNIHLSINENLNIVINNKKVLEKPLSSSLSFSHFEQVDQFGLIYLKGETSFVIIVENEDVKYADFYHEINIENKNRIFMRKCFDCLNHGRVAKLEDAKFEEYLVYLDGQELNMKNEFVHLIFMDCVYSKNLKYCLNLMANGLKPKDEKLILNFFEDFDEYIPFQNMVFVFKKNTLAGVYKFECLNNEIQNIIDLPFQHF